MTYAWLSHRVGKSLCETGASPSSAAPLSTTSWRVAPVTAADVLGPETREVQNRMKPVTIGRPESVRISQ